MNVWIAVAGVVAAILGGSGIGSIITAIMSRGKIAAEAADVVSKISVQFAKDVQADATAARQEAAAVRRELAEVRAEAHALALELRRLRLAILAPSASIDGLRALVNPPGANGGP